MEHADLVIIGGGQAGLAAAYVAHRAGLSPVLLEAGDEPVGSWHRYYDSLALFSPAGFSSLPGRPFPGDPERYPTRDDVVAYLRDYAAHLDADIRCGQRVESVEARDGAGFIVTAATGLILRADAVIAATGGFAKPHRPPLPGLNEFEGTVLHSAEYRSPQRFAGARVVVVGGGNSAVQIAAELAGVARVKLATRAAINWWPQRPCGRDVHWWLTRTGVDTAPIGRWLHRQSPPVIDDGRYQAALASGNPDHRLDFTGLEGGNVVWSDGAREPVDAVILATGYRPHLPYLNGTAALAASGRPRQRGGVSTTVPGLGYVGIEHQRSIASATLRGVGRDAGHVIHRLRAAAGAPIHREMAVDMRWLPGLPGACGLQHASG